MNVLRFDSVGGASGDMILAALIDLGVPREEILSALKTLNVDPFDIEASDSTDRGFRGTRVRVTAGHDEGHAPHGHAHRGLSDILARISGSGLTARAKTLSAAVFTRLADAEAAVHGTTVDRIHFHEVGAMDSIVDICGACVALDRLGVDRVVTGPLPCGVGAVSTAHGVLPLPAPATAELLKGHPVVLTDEPFELVTPTGAALLTGWQRELSGSAPTQAGQKDTPMTVLRTGTGLGHFRLQGRANLLRAVLLSAEEPPEGTAADADRCVVLECNLDDTVPELIGSLTERLLAAGALDAFAVPVQMKKQRPGTLLTALCRPADRAALIELIFAESTTFGIREYEVSRTILSRRHAEARTPYGSVRVKIGTWKGRDITFAPEHEDCARRAREHDVPVRTVYECALRARHT